MRVTMAMDETTLSDVRSHAAETLVVMDEETFRAFYERTARSVWAYLSRITGDRQLADDLLQEAYYRFYKLGDRHVDERHRRNSLFLIATNLARDTMRHRRHAYTVALPEEDDHSMLVVENREGARVEGRTDLARAMAHLEPKQRELLWLAYAQGASHHEIAETLGLKTQSIRTLLFRARKKLAGLLKGEVRHA
ncbi:MAG: RNA polymerase sigma factor [Acidobacteriota bacterium]